MERLYKDCHGTSLQSLGQSAGFFDKLAKSLWLRRGYRQHFVRDGVLKRDRFGMQAHALGIDAAQAAKQRHAVQRIARNGQTNRRQMHADLMRSARVRLATEHRQMPVPQSHVILANKFCICGFSVLAADAEFLDFLIGHFTNGGADFEWLTRKWIGGCDVILQHWLQRGNTDGTIDFLNRVRLELRGHAAIGFGRFGQHDDARREHVQAVMQACVCIISPLLLQIADDCIVAVVPRAIGRGLAWDARRFVHGDQIVVFP